MSEHLLIRGDARRIPIADGYVQCVVTSPPYFGLRDYGSDGQIGLEPTPGEFVAALVGVFREVWRVLRDDGVVWLNLGDSYANDTKWGGAGGNSSSKNYTSGLGGCVGQKAKRSTGLKPKDRMGIPHRVVFALQEDGWYWRDEIVWHKRNPMPESVTDRTTKAHEMVFLLTKRERYFYDADAIAEPMSGAPHVPGNIDPGKIQGTPEHQGGNSQFRDSRERAWGSERGRNKRSVWTINPAAYKDAHFATMPPELAETCIKAGSSEGGCCPRCRSPYARVTERTRVKRDRPNDYVKRTGEEGTGNSCANSVAGVSVVTLGWQPTCPCDAGTPAPCLVFDPFAGAGTTLVVAKRLGRRAMGTDLSLDYLGMAEERIKKSLRPVSKLDPRPVTPLPGQLSFLEA